MEDSCTERKPNPISLPLHERNKLITADEFEPNEHRKQDKPAGLFGTYLNMFKATFGTGMLSMPMAFKNMGVICGPIMVLITGILVIWCAMLMIKNIRKICIATKNAQITYPEAMRISMEQGPNWMRAVSGQSGTIVETFNLMCQFLTLGSYILFMANVSKQMCDNYLETFDIRFHVLFMAIPLLILNCFLRDLGYLAIFSVLGNIVQMIAVSISYYYMYGGFENIDKLEKVAPWNEIPLGFGMTVYSYISAGVIITLEFNMKEPKWFLKPYGVLNTGIIFTMLVYLSIGLIAYAKFGDNIAGTYIRNFPDAPLASVAVACFGLAVFVGFFIHIYPIMEIVLMWYKKRYFATGYTVSTKRLKFVDIVARLLIVSAATIFVIIFSEIHLLLGLIGSMCMCNLNIVFPCVMEYCMACYEEPTHIRRKALAALVGILSTVLCTMGIIISLVQMCKQAF